MPVEVNLPDKTLQIKQHMENKENVDSSAWNQAGHAVGKSSLSPSLDSSAILKQTSRPVNCKPDTLATPAVSKIEPAETKNLRMSFSQTFLHKRITTEKKLKPPSQNSSAGLPGKHMLGSYRGKIVSSKINSFRKTSENEERKKAVPAKSLVNTEPRRDRVTNTLNASKPISIASHQTKPPIKVSVDQPKLILDHEKRSANATSVNKVTVPKKPNKNWTPVLKKVPCNAASEERRTKKAVLPKAGEEDLASSASETPGTKQALASKTVGNRKSTLLQSAEVRRSQLNEWKASKVKSLKKPPASLPTNAQPAIEAQQTVKEPVESFWAAIAEEDEQQLFSDKVNETLTECLCLIEKGCSAAKVHATLEELILNVPDAKKLAKYWVCRMHLEQLGTLEKVMAVYEEAILAGAQPKDDLRNALAQVMKVIKNLPESDAECIKKKNMASCTVEPSLDDAMVQVQPNSQVKPNNEETSLKAEAYLKSEEESFPDNEEHRIEEQSRTPAVYRKEQNASATPKNGILAFKTPENDSAGSYLIKYNFSTTPTLESMKKKLQCENINSAVKDLKLLTPVRRSRRLQDNACKLPNMLKDNACVSSLEQLGELGEEATAFVYRANSALHQVLEGRDKM